VKYWKYNQNIIIYQLLNKSRKPHAQKPILHKMYYLVFDVQIQVNVIFHEKQILHFISSLMIINVIQIYYSIIIKLYHSIGQTHKDK